MVDVKISELPVAPSVATTDQLEANQAGTSRSITVAQVGTALALSTTYAPLASPIFTGDPQAPTPATADSDTSVATTAFVKAQGYQTAAQVTTSLGSYLPLAGGTLAGPGTLSGTTATFSGAVSTGSQFKVTGNDSATPQVLLSGVTKGLRFLFSSTTSTIEGVDNTGVGSFQPLTLGGSAVNLTAALTGTTATFSGTVSAPGAQLQMVSTQTGAMATGSTTIPFDDTIPQITEGNEYMTCVITPKSATSKLVIEVKANVSTALTSAFLSVALFQDATANALAVGWSNSNVNAGAPVMLTLTHVMTSGTTSATTFRVRAGSGNAGTTTFNGQAGARLYGGAFASSIVIREVA